ncbi:MAG TPA: hypothetical protein VEQ60_14450, partial [Longimicrobium sp.]|nr:hypothetical protein [Longimicrobium sp.]
MAKRNGSSTRKKLVNAARSGGRAVSEKVRKAARGAAGRSMAGMNVVMFITDQDRAIQHFPKGWAEEN